MAMQWLKRGRASGVATILLGAFLLALLTSEKALPARDEAKPAALPSDLAKIPSDGVFLYSVRVADLWGSPIVRPVREKMTKESGEAARGFEKEFGVSLEKVERMTLVLVNPPPSPEEPLTFLRSIKPYDRTKVIAALGENAKEEKYKGQALYTVNKKKSVSLLDAQTLVVGEANSIRRWIDHPVPKSEGNLAGALRLAAEKHSLVVGVNVKVLNDAVGDKLPGEMEPFKPLLRATSAMLSADLTAFRDTAMVHTAVKVNFSTEKDAQAGVEPLNSGLRLAQAGLDQSVSQLNKLKETAKLVEFIKQIQQTLKKTKIEQDGKTLRASARLKLDGATTGALAVAVQRVREAAARVQAQNNLKQIGLAMHNYHSTMGQFPAHATYDKNGKPLLSWRVMILPYIEQQNLYNQFHLNEPWDSEHNKKLLAKMPKTYASPGDEKALKEHRTHYQGFVGKGCFFEGKKGIRIPQDIPDGTSNTFMIVQASKAVPWSKPEDIAYDASKPLPKLGLPGAEGFLASLCDGSVRFVSKTVTEKTLRDVITRNDGNVIGADF